MYATPLLCWATSKVKSLKSIKKYYTYSAVKEANLNSPNKNLIGTTIDPWFITGLYYAEASFVVVILKNFRYKTGWNVQTRVQLKMHEKDRSLIQTCQDFFCGIGTIFKPNSTSTVEFIVNTL